MAELRLPQLRRPILLRGLCIVLSALMLLTASGCYERTTQGDQAIYHFAWWLGPAVIVGAILAVPAGWALRKVSERFGFALMILGPVLLVMVAPAMFSDRVVVDKDHFEARYGIWFSPSVHSIRFDDLREIRYVKTRGARGRTNWQLHCITKGGETRAVSAGDLVRQTVPEILDRARAKGLQVTTDEP
jgi:hypothetical protein